MKKIFINVLIIMNLLSAWALIWFMATRGFRSTEEYDGAELVSIILTAIGLIVAAMPIFLALLAFWGYSSLNELVRVTAEKKAAEVAKDIASEVAAEVASRAARAASDQEEGQGDGYGFAEGAGDPPAGAQ